MILKKLKGLIFSIVIGAATTICRLVTGNEMPERARGVKAKKKIAEAKTWSRGEKHIFRLES